MDMDYALETIDTYCDKLKDTNIGENEQKLHTKLRQLKTLVWADDYDTPHVLNLILQIYQDFAAISNKLPYTDIMKVVHFFERELARYAKITLIPSALRISGISMMQMRGLLAEMGEMRASA